MKFKRKLNWISLFPGIFFGHFFEKNDYNIGPGAHLYFMYRLTAFGILNFVLFFWIFIKHIKYNIRIFSQSFSFYFLLSALSIIILGLIKNLAGRELWYMYFFILPGLYYLPLLIRETTHNLNGKDLSDSKSLSVKWELFFYVLMIFLLEGQRRTDN